MGCSFQPGGLNTTSRKMFKVTIDGPWYYRVYEFRDEKKARDFYTDCLVKYNEDYEIKFEKK